MTTPASSAALQRTKNPRPSDPESRASAQIGPTTGIQKTFAESRQVPVQPLLLSSRTLLAIAAIPHVTPNVTAPPTTRPRRGRWTIGGGPCGYVAYPGGGYP